MKITSSQDPVVRNQDKTGRNGKIKISSFQDLEVWRLSHKLVLEIYKMSASFPDSERYGITSQMRRSVVSVPANIAEGFIRRTEKDKIHFYNIAQSSLHETKYYLILVKDLNFIASTTTLWSMAEEISKMLHGLIGSIKLNYARN